MYGMTELEARIHLLGQESTELPWAYCEKCYEDLEACNCPVEHVVKMRKVNRPNAPTKTDAELTEWEINELATIDHYGATMDTYEVVEL